VRRALLAALAVAAVAAFAVPAASPAAGGPQFPSRLLVTADEWSLALSRTKITPGDSIVELYNRGEDAHDVRIKRAGRAAFVPIPETGSEDSNRIQTRFKAGKRYVLWCSLDGHRELGMEAELRVSGR
jgi:plastocyanin